MNRHRTFWLSLTVGALALAAAGQLAAQPAPGAPTVSGADLAAGRGGRDVGTIPPNPNEPAPPAQDQNVKGMHVYLYDGLKSHPPGRHDYPQFLADWSKLLTAHGAVVDGSLHAPDAHDLEGVDVVVIFKGDAGYMSPAQRKIFDDYVKRGGGLVNIHDSLCGPDPAAMAFLLGGGKRHGEVNFSAGPLTYTIVDAANPIIQGVPTAAFTDEAFYGITWAPSGIHPLATVAMPGGTHKGEVVPQIWTYEHTVAGGKPARAFVWMQGDNYSTVMRPEFTNMLLRGIAWAGQHPVNELVDYKAPPAAGRRGGGEGGG